MHISPLRLRAFSIPPNQYKLPVINLYPLQARNEPVSCASHLPFSCTLCRSVIHLYPMQHACS